MKSSSTRRIATADGLSARLCITSPTRTWLRFIVSAARSPRTSPSIHGYNEAAFAELPDHRMPIEWSLDLLEGVHARWVALLNSMDAAQWKRTWNHSERGVQRLDWVTLLYAWHCRHHVAHITHLRAQQGW